MVKLIRYSPVVDERLVINSISKENFLQLSLRMSWGTTFVFMYLCDDRFDNDEICRIIIRSIFCTDIGSYQVVCRSAVTMAEFSFASGLGGGVDAKVSSRLFPGTSRCQLPLTLVERTAPDSRFSAIRHGLKSALYYEHVACLGIHRGWSIHAFRKGPSRI